IETARQDAISANARRAVVMHVGLLFGKLYRMPCLLARRVSITTTPFLLSKARRALGDISTVHNQDMPSRPRIDREDRPAEQCTAQGDPPARCRPRRRRASEDRRAQFSIIRFAEESRYAAQSS